MSSLIVKSLLAKLTGEEQKILSTYIKCKMKESFEAGERNILDSSKIGSPISTFKEWFKQKYK